MKLNKILLLFFVLVLMSGCGGGGGGSSSGGGGGGSSSSGGGGSTPPPVTVVVHNVLPITVNGPGCNSYLNETCVSVTVCTPGTSTCQTISNILLDTGSYGLRIFKQALTVPLTQETVGPNSLAECITYADGSADWGPVQTAGVILGSESVVSVPIQIIDSTFVSPSVCRSQPPSTYILDTSPSQAGFNGILGVGPFVQDCGPTCVSSTIQQQYFACTGSTCSGTTVSLSSQVQNPVALLSTDNNGVIVQLPGVPAAGSPSVSGSLVLGIGTQSNNAPSPGVTAYPTDGSGDIGTIFNGTTYHGSFIDSGSNGLFFPSSNLTSCTDNKDWFCPQSTTNFSAIITGTSGSPASSAISFQIGNFDSLINSNPSSNVFPDIGGNGVGSFDWGLPFFFGRNVYVGIEGTRSSLSSGPYFAY